MAIVLYTSVVSRLRGSVRGTTFQQTQYQDIARGKPIQVRPLTNLQTQRKSTLTQVAASWRTLTGTQRSSWLSFATSYPTPIRKDPTKYLDGYNLFVKYNALRQLHDRVTLRTTSLTLLDEEPGGLEVLTDGVDLIVGVSFDTYTPGVAILAFLSPPMAGHLRPKTTRTRFVGSNAPGTGPTTVECSTLYQQLFARLPEPGEYVSVDVTVIGLPTAQIYELPTTLVQVQEL